MARAAWFIASIGLLITLVVVHPIYRPPRNMILVRGLELLYIILFWSAPLLMLFAAIFRRWLMPMATLVLIAVIVVSFY